MTGQRKRATYIQSQEIPRSNIYPLWKLSQLKYDIHVLADIQWILKKGSPQKICDKIWNFRPLPNTKKCFLDYLKHMSFQDFFHDIQDIHKISYVGHVIKMEIDSYHQYVYREYFIEIWLNR